MVFGLKQNCGRFRYMS